MELERIFKENGGYFGEKKLWEIFEIKSSKKIFHAQELEILDNFKENNHPYVVRSALNNWIRGWVSKNENFLNEWNTLSFAQDTFSVFYQENPYFTGNKVKILKSKFNWMNNLSWIFLSSNFLSLSQKIEKLPLIIWKITSGSSRLNASRNSRLTF